MSDALTDLLAGARMALDCNAVGLHLSGECVETLRRGVKGMEGLRAAEIASGEVLGRIETAPGSFMDVRCEGPTLVLTIARGRASARVKMRPDQFYAFLDMLGHAWQRANAAAKFSRRSLSVIEGGRE